MHLRLCLHHKRNKMKGDLQVIPTFYIPALITLMLIIYTSLSDLSLSIEDQCNAFY